MTTRRCLHCRAVRTDDRYGPCACGAPDCHVVSTDPPPVYVEREDDMRGEPACDPIIRGGRDLP